MGDTEVAHIRPPETITITVLRARNLRGSNAKADVVNATIKVEFGEKSLGESPKVDCMADTPAEFNYNATMSCTYDDPTALDEIAHKPIVLTVIEVLPKEKKQKEEKTITLGQCTVDLLPLVKGETKYRYSLAISPVPGSPMESIPADAPRPEVDVLLSVNEPLVGSGQTHHGNLVTITMESLYSPPEAWGLSGVQYAYAAALPLPINAEKENPIVFANGTLKPGVDKEPPNKQKKWAVPATALGNAVYIPDSYLSTDAIDDEDGDYRGKEDREHRTSAEHEKNRVTWNTERRSYLEASAVKSLQDKIAKCRYWPVEVMRLPQPAGGKGKKTSTQHGGKDDDGSVSFHGVAFINLAPLLYPGVKRIRGAYKIYSYTDQALYEKTKRRAGFGEEAAKIANNILNRSTASPGPKKGAGKDKDDKKDKDNKKGRSNSLAPQHDEDHEPHGKDHHDHKKTSQTVKSDAGSEPDSSAPVNLEGQQYVEAKSYMMFEISLSHPLIPKRPPEELARRVAEYIPPRPLFPKRTDGAQRAVEDFHTQVASVAGLVLDEFRDMFGAELKTDESDLSQEAMETRRQKLIYELNASGKYFAFKEQLKHSVVKIVREKYLKTTNFEDRQELQTFLSELYVYLIDQMHESLTKTLALEDQAPVPAPLTDSAQLKHFAREAEVNGNFELATKYYQERIARNRNDPSHWFDYGTFCLYINDITKAEECFRECVSIDQKHLQGLLLYGVVCTLLEKHEMAETFFEAATNVQPRSILAWTMLGLYYDTVQNEIGAEMAYIEANKLNQQAAVAAARALREEELAKQRAERSESDTHTADQGGLAPPASNSLVPDIKQPTPPSSERGPGSARSSDKMSAARRPSASKRSSAGMVEYHIVEVEGRNEGAVVSQLSERPLTVDKPGQLSVPDSRDATRAGRNKSDNSVSRPGSEYKHGSVGETPHPPEESGGDQPVREPTPVPTSTIFMQAIDWLLEVKAVPFTERALAHELLSPLGGATALYHISLARVKLQKRELHEAEDSLNEALQFDYQNPDAWALMGHVKYLTNETAEARDRYERTISFVADASEMHSIYLRLASIYLQEERFQEAKTTFLMACKKSPSCVSWLGVGIACYRLGELAEAEDALSEANILNNSDPEVWGYLSLVCLKTGRQLEAEQAYKYAIKVNLEDTELMDEIIRTQKEVGFGNPQF